MTEESEKGLYAKIFSEQHYSDKEAKKKLIENALPMEKRFSKNLLSRMLHFLTIGYAVKSYNEYQSNGLYETILNYNDKEELFVTEYPFPEIIKDKESSKERALKEAIEGLIAKMIE